MKSGKATPEGSSRAKRSRKLVVHFNSKSMVLPQFRARVTDYLPFFPCPRYLCYFPEDSRPELANIMNPDKRRQLVHNQDVPSIPKTGRIDRLLVRIGVKETPILYLDKAVLDAHTFVRDNYQMGDEVILLAIPLSPRSSARIAAEALARHLIAGTSPGASSSTVPSAANQTLKDKIPIHGIVGEAVGLGSDGASEFYNGLKSSFPHTTKYIKFSFQSSDMYWIHSTNFGPDGGVILREVRHFLIDHFIVGILAPVLDPAN
ncbi:unnamed protein product [Rhizoctonia solani]|uniref:Uncharacterized protein n=1 Tax=Rhizoctonia solani TaxID=456999 RepID=A0A8H3E494_9AGAM|nr:unnamed protein product [Rhizoctonia solani]